MRLDLRIFALLTLTTAVLAQSHVAPAPDPTGTVTGRVYCADTNEPARFAHVSLQPVPAVSILPASSRPKPAAPSMPAPTGSVETTIDGSFRIANVKPGSYIVVVDKQGYISPHDIFTPGQLADPTPQVRALVAAASPTVVVQPNQTETAQVSLIRGAAISGRILYDDGSPAAELNIKLLRKDPDGKWKPLEFDGRPGTWINTDDRGYFRAASLLANDYIVEADLNLADSKTVDMAGPDNTKVMLNMEEFRFSLPFYGTGTAHLPDAKPVTLPAGQEITGADMTIPIAKLHRLTGRVAAGKDAHFVNAATVTLVNRDDNSKLADATISREDGLFHFEFVPDGDYILKVSNARDVTWEPARPSPGSPMMLPQRDVEHVVATYGNTEEPILLSGDLLDTLATISPDAVAPAAPTARPGALDVNAQSPVAPPSDPTPAPQAAPHAAPPLTPEAKSDVASLHTL